MAEAIKQVADQVADGIKKLAVVDDQTKQQQQGKKKEKKSKGEQAGSGPDELSPPPKYIQDRLELFDQLKKEYDAEIAAKPREDITVTLPDGKSIYGKSWETTPGQIARDISKSLYERVFISRVNGEVWDLERPLEESCKLELLDFADDEAKLVYWHSSAHVLGECSERRWGCDLCIGPPLKEGGFYYEMRLPEAAPVYESDYQPLEKIAAKAIKDKQVFERLVLSKENLLKMFDYNKYKQHIINDKIADGTSTTIYRNGPFIDLCRGPHIPHTGRIKTFKVMKNSASYFLGDAANDSLQRIYGISFPDKKLMDEHLHYLEEAAKRDHRKIGTDQELWFFHPLSPGSCFFMPKGMTIYNSLLAFLREEYWKRGYQEVQTPNLFNSDLWKQSGHWEHYQDDMFTMDIEKQKWALKPMNCPSHCLIFGHRERSYRELPLRMADFGVLHRNEASGALSGLTRVRRFQQDDTHIFCTREQIVDELGGLFDFVKHVYSKFGFTFKMKLSTRPEKFLGTKEEWDDAEARLSEALDKFHGKGGWEVNPGDGAFYGPKVDITISDALRREHQCATIQLDFQLPQRFELEYVTPAPSDAPISKQRERPVMLHRAIYGSLERFMAILTEHLAGRWPFWLSPRQVLIIPVAPAVNAYCEEVQARLRQENFHADVDLSGNTMLKKIRTGQLALYNFIFVLGAQERDSGTVNIRNRDDQATQKMGELIPLDKAIDGLKKLKNERRLENKMI